MDIFSLRQQMKTRSIYEIPLRVTFYARVSSEKDEQLSCFPEGMLWNSKKWRTLFFFSDTNDLLFAARQYPFSLHEQLEDVKNEISKVLNCTFGPWCDKTIEGYDPGDGEMHYLNHSYIGMGGKLRAMNEVIDNKCELHFNDLLYSTCSKPMWAYKVINYFYGSAHRVSANAKVEIGHMVKCVHCGELDILSGDTFFCKECELKYGTCEGEDFAVCHACGEHFFYDDGEWDADDNLYCPDCASEVLRYCDCCGNAYHYNDVVYDDENNCYCMECWREKNE